MKLRFGNDVVRDARMKYRAQQGRGAARPETGDQDQPEMLILAMVAALSGAIMGFLFAGAVMISAVVFVTACVGGFLGWNARRIVNGS